MSFKQKIISIGGDIIFFFKPRKMYEFKIPTRLMFTVSSYCNAGCVFCSYRKLSYKKGVMSLETYKKAIDEFIELGGKEVLFSGNLGEIFLDTSLPEKIVYAKEKKLRISGFTNGYLLTTKDSYKMIVDNFDRIDLSVGDIDPAREARIYNVSIDRAKAKLDGILKLIRYKEECNSKIKIELDFRPMRKFSELWNDLLKSDFGLLYKKGLFTYAMLTEFASWAGKISQEDLIGTMKMAKVRKKRTHLCSNLYEVSILPDGDVRLCGCIVKDTLNDELVVGNINQNTLKEILTGSNTKKVLSSFLEGNIPDVCKDCCSYSRK